MRLLVDTNVLVRLRDAASPLSSVCEQAVGRLRQEGHDLVACAQVAIEFWVVVTRPREANGLGMTPAQAEAALRDFDVLLRWLPEPPDLAQRWRRLVTRYFVSGKPAHDARLVALRQAHRLPSVLTLNPTDFSRYSGIRCLSPHDVITGTLSRGR
ncbi:MAG: PIN domain nuclease [Armatimonadetes bacterium CG_4_10_14_3_um_filter_66_18]|nr:PIN domain-containing protein [Armatimonadota bacterium]OIP12610.1 MAG: hypothetical protein AUJ96_00290 [Armatimonadetes bacterium CG2_30_66_41]PIU92049.1 MAG: PIN domain nuclease [Armatimonadetes bacterium CG06_land_8_20_14_3_00_66_21]PIW20487.1 MAG: PIN domain nuclease [Armatimonadetes bacterium CG17_big_fil_post_rev_8_21_14_2_50_66_6]PIX40358.1 MAG: PIN domain nuclease [Armatimonadetes bacterium CG_4_8_14_3_um_filter_66_20]PIY42905.1 MAG: PIN domain nuclease [Armatimonadetes bacterium C